MRTKGLIMLLGASMFFIACKKDEGLVDADKAKFIKQYGTLAEGVDMKQTADGGFIMLGTTQGDGSTDIYLKKADAFGTDQWSKTFDGGEGFDDVASAIEILSNGNYAIVGTTSVDSLDVTISSTLVIITDANGNAIPNGIRAYNSGVVTPGKVEHETGHGLFVSSTGNLIVVSERVRDYDNIKRQIGVSRAIDPNTLAIKEEILGASPPSGQGDGFDIGFRDIVKTNSDLTVATGYTNNTGSAGTAGNSIYIGLLTSDAAAFAAGLPYGSLADDIGNSIIENSAGDIVISGTTAANGNNDFYVVSFDDADFDPDISLNPPTQWIYTGSNPGEEEAFSITEVSGGYVIAGYTETAENRQMYLEKINSDGSSMLWNKDYGFVDFDEAKAIVATSDNGLAVLGTSSDERGNRVMTLLKLDANGNLR